MSHYGAWISERGAKSALEMGEREIKKQEQIRLTERPEP